jgi:hypothetical protein
MKGFAMKASRRSIAAIVTASALLAACGGGGGSGGGSVAPRPATAPISSNAQGTIALNITIPKKTTASATRRLAYVSASTQSLALTITQGATPVLQQAISLSPASNPNCTTTAGATTCTALIGLAAGTYTGTFATYDGPVVSSAATGNVLSRGASIPVTVMAGVTNSIPVTMDGVPASISIAPASGSTITGTQAAGFAVPYTAQPMLIEALDADGNIIVGPGTPTFTASATATKFAVTQPTTGTPNQITLAAAAGGTGTITIAAAPPNAGFSCVTSGIVCTASATIATGPHTLFVANSNAITVYQSMDNSTWTLIATQAITGPVFSDVLTAAPGGTLFNATQGMFSSTISMYAPPFTGSATTLSGVQEPGNMVVTPAGQLLVADQYHLHVYTSPYTSAPASTNFPITTSAYGIALDGSNDAIVSTYSGTWLFSAPSYTAVATTINTIGGPVAVNASGTLFLGNESAGGQVLVYPAPYTSTSITLNLPGEGGTELPRSMVVDANGNLWVATQYSGSCPCNEYLFEFAPPFTNGSTPSFAEINPYWPLAADSAGDIIVPTASSTLSIINGSGTTVGTVTSSINNPMSIFYLH